jgi:Protein of unknown function (DUF2561)
MVNKYSAYRRGDDSIPPDVVDRILVGACAAVWLILLGVSVAAAVALADLGRGFHKSSSNPHTTWILYTVIAVSALIIAGAIPVLVRARRSARAEPAARGMTAPEGEPVRTPVRVGAAAGRPTSARSPSATAHSSNPAQAWSGAAVDRVWLRGTVLLTGTMGAALIGVATATYLMAIGHEGPSWVGYGIAGAVTAALPVVEWLHVRQLRQVIAEH